MKKIIAYTRLTKNRMKSSKKQDFSLSVQIIELFQYFLPLFLAYMIAAACKVECMDGLLPGLHPLQDNVQNIVQDIGTRVKTSQYLVW